MCLHLCPNTFRVSMPKSDVCCQLGRVLSIFALLYPFSVCNGIKYV